MSFHMAMVNNDFGSKCREDKIGLGVILEKTPEKVPEIPKEISDKVKSFLLGGDYNKFTINNESEHETVLYNNDQSVEIIITKNVIYFKTGISDPWPVLDLTVHLYEVIDYELVRFDFQDGHWG